MVVKITDIPGPYYGERVNEMREWALDNCETFSHMMYGLLSAELIFHNPDDAFLFKMRWGGDTT